MPTFTEETFVREILIVRTAPDADVAAHQVKITVVKRDGVVFSEQYLPAEPLAVEDIGDALDPLFVALANERDATIVARDAALAAKAALESQVADLQTQLAALEPAPQGE